jgi:hypothetical protein
MIDISTIYYDVELITENGTRYLLNDALIHLEWEENIRELAQRATLTVANFKIGTTFLHSLAKINCVIQIHAKWNGGGKQLMFDGTIWEWHYVSATNKELTLTCYDRLIRLQQSKDFKYYSAGMTTQAIIGDICGDWGVPFSYRWAHSLTHEKTIFNGIKISDMIIQLLEEVTQKTGEKYIVMFRGGQLQIIDYGTNNPVYRLDPTNTISTSDKLTINDLVTRVKVLGKQDNDGRAPVDALVDGDTRFGVLQEIIRRDSDKTIEAALAEANALIKQRGKPEEITQINVPDVPPIRKGDRVEISAGNLIGHFFVEGVTHMATTRRMALMISRHSTIPTVSTTEQLTQPTQTGVSGGGGAGGSSPVFEKGDEVILNGPAYTYSSGGAVNRTYTNYRSIVTVVAPLDRYAPFHIGAVGWARGSDLTRG